MRAVAQHPGDNIASLLSFQGGIRVPAYAASKGAVAQLSKALSNEWAGRGVQVNAIAPGYFRTENTSALQKDVTRNRQIVERIPSGDWGLPSQLAGTAVFLASSASDYVTGEILTVDGGWMARCSTYDLALRVAGHNRKEPTLRVRIGALNQLEGIAHQGDALWQADPREA